MCDRRPIDPSAGRPRWRALYALVLGGAIGYVAIVVFTSEPARTLLACALGAAVAAGAFGWVHANRVALDQLDSCACAATTVRVIEPRSATSSPASTDVQPARASAPSDARRDEPRIVSAPR